MNTIVNINFENNINALLLFAKAINPCKDCIEGVNNECKSEECYIYNNWWKIVKMLQEEMDNIYRYRYNIESKEKI